MSHLQQPSEYLIYAESTARPSRGGQGCGITKIQPGAGRMSNVYFTDRGFKSLQTAHPRYVVVGGSVSTSVHFMFVPIGSIRKTTLPPWKIRTVPVDSETAIAMASVAFEISAAAQ